MEAASSAKSASTTVEAAWKRLRQGSLGVLLLIVIDYVIGMYVNLYVTVPAADHNASGTSAISNGPGTLTAHAVIGLLLGLGAIAMIVQAILVRRAGVITSSAIGLLALAAADAAGFSFTSSGRAAESMGMSVLSGIAIACYAVNLYLVRRAA